VTVATDPVAELELLVRSRYSLIRIAGAEQSRVGDTIEKLAAAMKLPLFTWTSSKGLRRSGMPNAIYDTTRPEGALAHVEAAGMAALYHFEGLGHALADPALVARLKDAAMLFADRCGAILLSAIEGDFPDSRGILLLGVPGCGKSLCAKAVARDWGLPLLRLDTGALYDKYVGETERHFRTALATADRLSLIVLEIEQAVVSALYDAFSSHGELSTAIILDELSRTHPLSRTMGEQLDALRDWARDRTVPAAGRAAPRARRLSMAR